MLIDIQQPFPANGWGLRILLKNRETTKVMYEVRGDVFLNFADVAWSEPSQTVRIFVCGTPTVRVAYDMKRGASVPFDRIESILATDIKSRYHVNGNTKEVYEWACADEGESAFLRAHPGAAPR